MRALRFAVRWVDEIQTVTVFVGWVLILRGLS